MNNYQFYTTLDQLIPVLAINGALGLILGLLSGASVVFLSGAKRIPAYVFACVLWLSALGGFAITKASEKDDKLNAALRGQMIVQPQEYQGAVFHAITVASTGSRIALLTTPELVDLAAYASHEKLPCALVLAEAVTPRADGKSGGANPAQL